jgi:hypothetical protein
MLGKKDLARFQAALPTGVEPRYTFRAEPPFLQQFLYVLLVGVIFQLLFRSRPRSYLVGLADDALLLLPQPQPADGPALHILPREELVGITVKGGFGGKKIVIQARGAWYRMRIPHLQARGDVKQALAALAQFGATPPKGSAPASVAPPAAPADLPSSAAPVAAPAAVEPSAPTAPERAPSQTETQQAAPVPQEPAATPAAAFVPVPRRPAAAAASGAAASAVESGHSQPSAEPAFHTPALFAAPQSTAAVDPAGARLAPFCDRCGRAFEGDEQSCPNDGRARRKLEA